MTTTPFSGDDQVGGLTSIPLYSGGLGWWDAMHDEGALVAWGLWAAGR